MSLFPRREPTGNWIRDHSLSLGLALVVLLTKYLYERGSAESKE